jgi:long-subunit fatty acid transport protein
MFRNVTGYNADIYFKGTSVFFGYQGGLTYQINQFLGVYGGVRFVTAKNTYEGHIKDVLVSAAPTDPLLQDPPLPLYDVPAGDYTPGNYLRAVAGATGLPAPTVAVLNGTADLLDAQTGIEADAEEKGNGYTPILGANISIGDRVDIGLKYEFKTKLELTQTVHDGKDAYGMFVQDSTVQSDMPAMLSAGVGVMILPNLKAMAGLHYYFDKDANYGKTLNNELVANDKVIDKNTVEIAVGLEYNLTPKLLVSGGYLLARSGVSEDYQSDISFDQSSNSGAIGLGYSITPKIKLNLGFTYVKYTDSKKDYIHVMEGTGFEVPATQNYESDAVIVGIGADFSF